MEEGCKFGQIFKENPDKYGDGIQKIRLFVGGLSQNTTVQEVKDKFARYGDLKDIEFVSREGKEEKIAYITLLPVTDSSISQCLNTFNNTKWRGNTLRIQKAKPHYTIKYFNEKIEEANRPKRKLEIKEKVFDPKDNPSWKVAKEGRAFFVGTIRTKDSRKPLKYDGVKYKRNIKRVLPNLSMPSSASSINWQEIPERGRLRNGLWIPDEQIQSIPKKETFGRDDSSDDDDDRFRKRIAANKGLKDDAPDEELIEKERETARKVLEDLLTAPSNIEDDEFEEEEEDKEKRKIDRFDITLKKQIEEDDGFEEVPFDNRAPKPFFNSIDYNSDE